MNKTRLMVVSLSLFMAVSSARAQPKDDETPSIEVGVQAYHSVGSKESSFYGSMVSAKLPLGQNFSFVAMSRIPGLSFSSYTAIVDYTYQFEGSSFPNEKLVQQGLFLAAGLQARFGRNQAYAFEHEMPYHFYASAQAGLINLSGPCIPGMDASGDCTDRVDGLGWGLKPVDSSLGVDFAIGSLVRLDEYLALDWAFHTMVYTVAVDSFVQVSQSRETRIEPYFTLGLSLIL